MPKVWAMQAEALYSEASPSRSLVEVVRDPRAVLS